MLVRGAVARLDLKARRSRGSPETIVNGVCYQRISQDSCPSYVGVHTWWMRYCGRALEGKSLRSNVEGAESLCREHGSLSGPFAQFVRALPASLGSKRDKEGCTHFDQSAFTHTHMHTRVIVDRRRGRIQAPTTAGAFCVHALAWSLVLVRVKFMSIGICERSRIHKRLIKDMRAWTHEGAQYTRTPQYGSSHCGVRVRFFCCGPHGSCHGSSAGGRTVPWVYVRM